MHIDRTDALQPVVFEQAKERELFAAARFAEDREQIASFVRRPILQLFDDPLELWAERTVERRDDSGDELEGIARVLLRVFQPIRRGVFFRRALYVRARGAQSLFGGVE